MNFENEKKTLMSQYLYLSLVAFSMEIIYLQY